MDTLDPRPASGSNIRRYHVVVKPVGALCNLNCTYCYYLPKQQLLNSRFRMSDEVLETHIQQYIQGQDGTEVVFTWQGGEPTLLGLPFFEKIITLQQKHRRPGQHIENDLQTNGTLLDDDWCCFLKRHNWLVGLSIDGPQELHDRFRVAKDGKPTFARVFTASQLLRKHGIRFNTVSVINRWNALRPLDVYRFISREIRPYELQFIPCVERATFRSVAPQKWGSMPELGSSVARPGPAESIVTEWSVDPDEWGMFLCKVWDDWYSRDFGKVFVNLFETAVAQWMGMDAQICVYHEFCGKSMALEHDGTVYSCDHYVYPEYKLTSILETTSSNMAFSDRQKKFGLAKFSSLPRYCRECKYLFACNGECPRNRFIRTPAGESGLNYLCSGLKRFWAHIDPMMPEIKRRIAAAS